MLKGSHGITFFDEQGGYDVNRWLEAVSAITSPDQPVVLICASGVRSLQIARFLDKRLELTSVQNVTDGIAGWIRGGLPVTPYQPE
jgi:rhodanese-related sulfurtransferase